MSTPWEDDVAEALRCAYAGQAENWPLIARTLAAEVTELRDKLNDKLAEDLRRCPRCGRVADQVTVCEGKPTVYWHGGTEHLDGLADLKVTADGGGR
jgi:uncharacterized protein with PIN domain